MIGHRNARWRIGLADEEAGRTENGEGEDFGKAWDDLNREPLSGRAAAEDAPKD